MKEIPRRPFRPCRPSEEVRALLERVYGIPPLQRLWDWFTTAGEGTLEMLARIRATASPAVLPHLVPLLFHGDPQVVRATASMAAGWLAEWPAADFPSLDRVIRNRSFYLAQGFGAWWELRPTDLDAFLLKSPLGELEWVRLGLCSFHGNGHVREAAVARLAVLDQPGVLPFLIVRLNDWVGPVRDRAVAALRGRLEPRTAATWVRCLPLVQRLEGCGRRDPGDPLATVKTWLRSEGAAPAVWEGLATGPGEVRRSAWRLVLEAPGDDLERLVSLGLDDPDPVIRTRVVARALPRLPDGSWTSAWTRCRRDRSPRVRQLALRQGQARRPDLAPGIWEEALADPSGAIRQEARFWLEKAGHRDLAGLYRRALDEASARPLAGGPPRPPPVRPSERAGGGAMPLWIAIAGLGETGGAADAEMITPYLSHPAAKVRRAALGGLAGLAPAAHVEEFLVVLSQDLPSLARQATTVLQRQIRHLDPERLVSLLGPFSKPHRRRAVFHLLGRLSKWDALERLLEAVVRGGEEELALGLVALGRWQSLFNRSFVEVPPGQRLRLVALLESAGGRLPARLTGALRGLAALDGGGGRGCP